MTLKDLTNRKENHAGTYDIDDEVEEVEEEEDE